MRLIAILSPTDKWGTKTEYARLRKFLLKDGYIRIGPEVFMRVVQNRKASEKHYRRIDEVKPKTGVVRLLRLTEKQYNNIYMVTGEPDYQEKTVGVPQYAGGSEEKTACICGSIEAIGEFGGDKLIYF